VAASGPDLLADGALLLWTHSEGLLDAVDAAPPESKERPPAVPDGYADDVPPPRRASRPASRAEGEAGGEGEAGLGEVKEGEDTTCNEKRTVPIPIPIPIPIPTMTQIGAISVPR